MKKNNNILPAIILASGLIIASIIYAFAHRYEMQSLIRIDKWTGTYVQIEMKN